ncbi:hypothetical protein D9611_007057 [Ephemerocybe angulata]|uniref:(4-O-methyl)-D-glucuronate--lignin esterase n=1 Tax=Ephemerocybe angulata TaxID=980116 RepID=A0A8H5B230_9AGAR|nr:hypothetical protein D9611_007057 [Tulosesus angulatus]
MITFTRLAALLALLLPVLAQDQEDASRCSKIPDEINLTPLTDPFTFFNGQRVNSKSDWTCRRAEISQLVQRYQLGQLPTVPSSAVKATYFEESRPKVNVAVTVGDKSISFNVTIVPATEPGKDSSPAIISVGGTTIPTLTGVANILFNNDEIAAQTSPSASRGVGLFYDLYGKDHSAGSLMAWAWGIGRVIDALEKLPEAKIDTKHLGVTGCSRNGKGVLIAGAFEPRIALTIPQEGGAGGPSCWRISDYLARKGINTQTAHQIITENTWHSPAFEPYVNQVGILPFDQHLVTALIAPRALYVPENDVEWLGPESAWGCQRAARTVWEALGVEDRIGFDQTAVHSHCLFPESEVEGLTAFVDRFLRGKKVKTDGYFKTEAEYPDYSDKFWRNWRVPTLR